MKKGDIVLIPFPFTDLTGLKNRPALILINSEDDVTVAFISSQIKADSEFDLIINPAALNGLKKISLLRISKLATLEKSLIIGKLGNLSLEEIENVNKNLILAFKLNQTT